MHSLVWESAAIRSLGLLSLAAMMAFGFRRGSASLQHRIWTLGLAGSLLVPLVTWASPGWELSVLPATTSSGPTRESGTNRRASVPLSPTIDSRPQTRKTVVPRESETFATAADLVTGREAREGSGSIADESARENTTTQTDEDAPVAASTLMPTLRRKGSDLALGLWLSVSAALLVRRWIQYCRVRRWRNDCQPCDNAIWNRTVDELRRSTRVKPPVTLMSHPDSSSPLVTGLWRVWLVLPDEANRWHADRFRMVVLHELAHVKRKDLWTQWVASLACAVHWFNPLAWYAARQMRDLREVACDDWVVRQSGQPTEYADTLLKIAQDVRRPPLAMTVTMARTSAVAKRVLAVLDSTRNRTPVSRRAASILTCVFATLVAVSGGLQLTAMAQTPTDASVASNAVLPADARTMRVRVLDDQGQPLVGANVLASLWEVENTDRFPTKNYQTDSQGEAKVLVPEKVRILRLWPSSPGYVPLFLNFAEGKHQEGEQIPGSYDFYLQRGHRISGTVVDENDQPVLGAKVQVRVSVTEPPWGSHPKPMISAWLASGDDAVITDSQGRWEIQNAPAPKPGRDYEFELQVTHPDYSSDTRWGELQAVQGVSTAQFRDGTAKITLDPGLRIQGNVVGPQGEPVVDGLVIWNDRPYWADGVNEAFIDGTGWYQSLPLRPGKYPVTVMAPGYAPQRVEFQLDPSSQDLNFTLGEGKSLELQIVDPSGQPVPDVYVSIQGWRGTEAIYNHKHSNVPESGIPRTSGPDGVYRWDWAPEDAVTFRLGKKGYRTEVGSWIPKDEPHRVVLASQMKIRGKVTDKVTGNPVDRFSVVPVTEFRPDFYSTSFQDRVEATGGQFEIGLQNHGQSGNRYRARIEAEGYRTALGTKSIGQGDPTLTEDFQLEPASSIKTEVRNPDGQPATGLTVAIGTPSVPSQFLLKHLGNSFGIVFEVPDGNAIELAATFEPQRIRVFNDDGFAEILHRPGEPLPAIDLQPWATVRGRLMQGERAIANQWVVFQPLVQRGLTEARFQDSFSAKSDSNGHFQLDKLPPMPGRLQAQLGPWQPSPMTSSQSVPMNLRAGDSRNVILGQGDHRITGRVVAEGRDNDQLSKQWSLNYLVSRAPASRWSSQSKQLSIAPDQPLDMSILKNDDFASWLAAKDHYYVKLADDGSLQVDGVPPGQYDLLIQLYEQPVGCLVETIGQKIVPITVAAGSDRETENDLGDIAVRCRRGPRVGADMRAFSFIDTDGRQRSVDEMEGRFVLFHFWASWCEPCLATMPEMKATLEGHVQSPLTAVGWNIDDDPEQAKAMADRGEWNWAMNYLGGDSALSRQLGLSSVPAYYLIGRDGKLVLSSSDWNEVRQRLDAELTRRSSGRP